MENDEIANVLGAIKSEIASTERTLAQIDVTLRDHSIDLKDLGIVKGDLIRCQKDIDSINSSLAKIDEAVKGQQQFIDRLQGKLVIITSFVSMVAFVVLRYISSFINQ